MLDRIKPFLAALYRRKREILVTNIEESLRPAEEKKLAAPIRRPGRALYRKFVKPAEFYSCYGREVRGNFDTGEGKAGYFTTATSTELAASFIRNLRARECLSARHASPCTLRSGLSLARARARRWLIFY